MVLLHQSMGNEGRKISGAQGNAEKGGKQCANGWGKVPKTRQCLRKMSDVCSLALVISISPGLFY